MKAGGLIQAKGAKTDFQQAAASMQAEHAQEATGGQSISNKNREPARQHDKV
ncbi:MAG: hypothetical protein V1735_02200 [Nanoarchaeota archaeon]